MKVLQNLLRTDRSLYLPDAAIIGSLVLWEAANVAANRGGLAVIGCDVLMFLPFIGVLKQQAWGFRWASWLALLSGLLGAAILMNAPHDRPRNSSALWISVGVTFLQSIYFTMRLYGSIGDRPGAGQ